MSLIKQRRSITERPAEVEGRGDRLLGSRLRRRFARRGQGLLVLHERQTRFSIVQHPVDRKAVLTARTIARQLGKLPEADENYQLRQRKRVRRASQTSPTPASELFFIYGCIQLR